jgi:uncharacterized RDD family membrane protein YckC
VNSMEGPTPVNPQPPSRPDYSIERDLGLAVKICPGCRTSNLPSSKYCYKCGLTLPDQATIPGEMSVVTPAGFWRRFASFIIDNIFIAISSFVIFSIIFAILLSIFPDLADKYTITEFTWDAVLTASEVPMTWLDRFAYAGWLVFGIAYWTVAIGWKGRTVGKLMLGMKVVRSDGSRVGYLRAFGRCWGYVLCCLTLGFGFLAIAWNKQKRGLHDLVCDTMVIKI